MTPKQAEFERCYGPEPSRSQPDWSNEAQRKLVAAKIRWKAHLKHFLGLLEELPTWWRERKVAVYRRWLMGTPLVYQTTAEGGVKTRMSFPEAYGLWWKQVKVFRMMSSHLHVGRWQRDSVYHGYYFAKLHPLAARAPGVIRMNEENKPVE